MCQSTIFQSFQDDFLSPLVEPVLSSVYIACSLLKDSAGGEFFSPPILRSSNWATALPIVDSAEWSGFVHVTCIMKKQSSLSINMSVYIALQIALSANYGNKMLFIENAYNPLHAG